ncbi:hypothetical protein ACH5RR_038076 [Cinchona calisaya]|uniref:Transcription factor CBF/NF-Y/archaeal histone domain-containing protein n=1 Tax=Cinchona calisaya TaxID=153742 RepID=A0ABD2YCP7_9GENT
MMLNDITNMRCVEITWRYMYNAGVVIREPNQNATNNIVNTNNVNANTRRDLDLLVPIANILRIMKHGLPSNVKVSEDAKRILQECVSEYISFITSEANERCHRELRKTITAEDILYAHAKLGFEDYVGPLTLYLDKYLDGAPLFVPPPPINQTFQVDGVQQQGFFYPTMMNDYYFLQNTPCASLGGGFDIGGSSSSNAEFPEPEAHPQPGLDAHDQEQFK